MSLLGTADLGVAFTGDIGDLLRASGQAGNAVDGFGKKAGGALRDVTKEARQTDDAMGRMANGIKSAFVGSSVAVGLITLKNQVVSVVSALTDAQVQVDRLKNGFSFGAGGAAAGAREMAFVRSEADRLGLALGSTATQYMKMVAASRGGSMAGEKTRELFRSISEASVVMGMSQDQTERSMTAVVQMMSKGKVTAEELRGQLGEHLPGAFNIAARAMGVTEVELNKLMETGSVLSDDFLPKFSAKLRELMAGSVEQSALSMQANLNRLGTAWLDFKQQVVQGGVGDAISKTVGMAATDIGVLGDAFEGSRLRGEGAFMALANAAGVVAGRSGFGLIEQSAELLNGTINLLTGGVFNLNTNIDLMPDNLKPVAQQMELTAAKVKAAEAEYAALAARLVQAPDNIYIKSELGNLARYIETLRIAQGEQRKLMGMGAGGSEPVGSVGSGDAALARAQRADYDKRKALRDETLKKYATDDEKYATEAKRLKDALGDLYSPDLDKRIRDNFIKPSRAAKKEVDDFQRVLDRVTAKDSGLDPSFYKDLNTLHAGYKAGRIDIDEYRVAVEMLVTNQKFAKDAVKEHADAVQAAAQSNNAAWDAEFEALEKKRLSNEAQIKTGRETLAQIQFETSLLGMNTLQREQATAMRELERQGIVKGTQAYEAYAEAIQKALADRAAQQKTLDFWKELDSTAASVFMDLAMNGEDAFKRLGESLKREVIQLLYEMTIKKWIFQIFGVAGGGVGGTATNLLSSAAQSYMTGGSTMGASTSAIGSWATGGMSTANMTGSLYANYAGTGIDGLLATNGAYGTAGTGTAAGASGSWFSTMGYIALIAAAVMVAENLYAKGYNRTALGDGPGTTQSFGNTSFTSDPRMGNSWQYNYNAFGSNERLNRELLEMSGMSKKWADIFSGTTRMATLFGRKLGAYGYQVDVAGGDAEVGGFARYKGGLFRSNKTVGIDIDPRDAAAVDALFESAIEGSRSMARAMGYSDEAINQYTGSLKVNFKGARTAEEQSKRMAEAMDNLNYELLKTASGGKMAREEFKTFMEGVQKDVEAAGISQQGLTDILAQGIVNGSSGAEIGAALSQNILGGIYATMAQNAFAPVVAGLMSQIITPMFTAMAAGVPVSQVISKQAISSIVAQAQAASAALNQVFANAEFQQAMRGISTAISGVAGAAAGVKVPSFKMPSVKAPKPANTTAQDTLRERIQLENELLRLQGNTAELRRRELLELKPSNRALQEQIWLLEDQQEAAEKLKDTWGDVIDSMLGEMKRLREEILGTTEEGKAYAMAEFTMATAQARAGDTAAAERLPDLARTLVDIAAESSASLSDLRAVQGSTLASLAQTREILGATFGIDLPKFAVGTNYVPRDMVAMIHEGEAIVPKAYNPAASGGAGSLGEVVAVLNRVRDDLARVERACVVNAEATDRLEQLTDRYTNGGSHVRTKAVPA